MASPAVWATLTADGICLTIAFACIVHAPQYTSPTDVALILLLENLIVPIWVFIGFGEVPNMWTFVGGAMLLCTLAAHEVWLIAHSMKSYRLRASVWRPSAADASKGTAPREDAEHVERM